MFSIEEKVSLNGSPSLLVEFFHPKCSERHHGGALFSGEIAANNLSINLSKSATASILIIHFFNLNLLLSQYLAS